MWMLIRWPARVTFTICSQCSRFNHGNSTLVSTQLGSGVLQKMPTTRWILLCTFLLQCKAFQLSGGFAMMDMSIFETLEAGQEKRGWLMTEIQVMLLAAFHPIMHICSWKFMFADTNFRAGSLSPAPIFNGWTQCGGRCSDLEMADRKHLSETSGAHKVDLVNKVIGVFISWSSIPKLSV